MAAVLAALSAAPAQAATLTVEKPCYRATDPAGDLVLAGSGFTPSGLVLLGSGDTTIGSAVADAKGNFRQKYQIPTPPETGRNARDSQFTFSATDNTDTSIAASVTFRTAQVFGDYNPGESLHPNTVRVRFSAFGFAAGFAAGTPAPTVYVHYVSPNGRHKLTVSLGRGSGVCGSIAKTKLRRLFPFKARRGTWTLQFDTRKVYKKASGSSTNWDRLTLTLS